jgi:hypothetical protein
VTEHTVRCDGIHCGTEGTATTEEGTPDGWLALSSDDGTWRFCSWECLIGFANDHLKPIAGD